MPVTIGQMYLQSSRYFWNNVTLTEATTSDAVDVRSYRNKVITFVSDTGGTLTIETDPAGDGNWGTYDTVTITADTRENYVFPTGMQHAKIRIAFSTAAKVTGSISMF